jgi:hypothetical protein
MAVPFQPSCRHGRARPGHPAHISAQRRVAVDPPCPRRARPSGGGPSAAWGRGWRVALTPQRPPHPASAALGGPLPDGERKLPLQRNEPLFFSPSGRRWREAPDEGGAGHSQLSKAPSPRLRCARRTSPRRGEESDGRSGWSLFSSPRRGEGGAKRRMRGRRPSTARPPHPASATLGGPLPQRERGAIGACEGASSPLPLGERSARSAG